MGYDVGIGFSNFVLLILLYSFSPDGYIFEVGNKIKFVILILMRLLALLVLLVLFSQGNGFRVLKGEQIPKDYPIGRIQHFSFGGDGRLFFKGVNNELGFVDAKTGIITILYILGDDEKIVDFKG